MQSTAFRVAMASLFIVVLAACGGGGGSASPSGTSTSTTLTVTGTAATGLAIPGAIVTGKCKVGTSTATTLVDGSYTLTITDGQLPCVLQITNPIDGIKLHTVVTGTGSTATANITPLTEMATARVLGSEPNVFFVAFDTAVATQKITSTTVQAAQTDIGLVLTGTVDTTALGNFISAPLKAATQGSPTTGDAQDKLLDALNLKLTSTQIGMIATALASNQTTDAIKQTVTSMIGGSVSAPVANAGAAQNVVSGTTVTLDASTSSAAAGKSLTYAWTLNSKPAGSAATLAAPTTAKPTFVADVAGSYAASVVVNDGTTASSAAAVAISADVGNVAPVANAGVAQNVVAGSVVTLDGSASSDANGDTLTYVWTLTSKPAGSSATLSSATSAKPTFTADVAGTYVATLTVNDANFNSTAVTACITSNIPILSASVSPANADFGIVPIGSTKTKTFTVTNTGNGSLTFRRGYPGIDGPAWSVSANNCGGSLLPGASCATTIKFTPNNATSFQTWLFFQFNELPDIPANNPKLTGTGSGTIFLNASVSPANADFGIVPIGSTSTKTFTVTNTGNGSLTFRSGYPATVDGAWSVSANNCGGSLLPGASCATTIKFTPNNATSFLDWAFFQFNELPDTPANNPKLTGTGSGVLSY